MGGCVDPMLLNGMYDQEAVRRHVNAEQLGGSSSSVAVALQGQGSAGSQVLALLAPDGTVDLSGIESRDGVGFERREI
ncbi:putative clathrin assembly protein [Cucumis melo var. makuwa]|uniref:Putative clathrin assembly protein n=1 Tax=Cucumis melo var. makuwa TaxID=1194695 RepID=A0A5D3E0G3_CUCMM|nr:putative clathrin assembly protein [Cucumis melo var. makuwa]